MRLDRPEKTPVSVSIFPDRDGRDEDYDLAIEFTDADGEGQSLKLPVHVVDQDRDRPASFPIAVDFSQDRTGFFGDEARREAVVRAAEDWAYFFDGTGLDPTPAGAETTPIWNPDGFNSTRRVTNEAAYTGYRLYAYGIDSPLLRSGGEPSRLGGFQSQGGEALPIRRSGGYEAEVKGNYNRKGWLVGLGDPEWWKATNLGDVASDLDSIAHHEIGHALVFNPANTRFGAGEGGGEAAGRAGAGLPGVRPGDRPVRPPGRLDRPGEPARGLRQRVPRQDAPGPVADHEAGPAVRPGRRLPAAGDLGLRPPDAADGGAARRDRLGPLHGDVACRGRHPVLPLGGRRGLAARRRDARFVHGRAPGDAGTVRGLRVHGAGPGPRRAGAGHIPPIPAGDHRPVTAPPASAGGNDRIRPIVAQPVP